MYLRRATHSDIEIIIRWRRDAADWLAEAGSDQWSDTGLDPKAFRDRVGQSIDTGETWMACTDDGTPVGTIALDQWSDDGLWNDDTLRRSLVIHRMIIERSASGQGVGKAMLQHAEQLAAERGLTWLILDAWTTNTDLHAYYERQGFEHVRTEPNMPSGALFQRRVNSPAERVLPTSIRRPLAHVDRPAEGNPSEPEHWHIVDTVTATAPRTRGGATSTLTLPDDDRLWHLWFEGGAWRIAPPGHGGKHTTFERDLDLSTYRVTNSPRELAALSPDVEYVIRHQATSDGCEVVVTAADD